MWPILPLHIRKRSEHKVSTHHKFWSKPLGVKQISIPKKAMTPREWHHNEAERMRKVQDHHQCKQLGIEISIPVATG